MNNCDGNIASTARNKTSFRLKNPLQLYHLIFSGGLMISDFDVFWMQS